MSNTAQYREAGKHLPRHPSGKAWKTRDKAKIKGLVFHQALGSGSVEDVAKYHIGPNHMAVGGLPSIAYTFAIRKSGEILMCLDWEEKPWSQGDKDREGDENAEFVSCLLEGCFKGSGVMDPSAGEPTLYQLQSVLLLWEELRADPGFNYDAIYGHFDFGKPSCPGNTMEAVIRAVRYGYTDLKGLGTVMNKQAALRDFGYDISVDGVWGPKSKKTLIEFQKDRGLVPDGVWGATTNAVAAQCLSTGWKL